MCLGHCANYANITLKNPSVETICIKTVKKYRFLLPQIPHIRWHFQTFYVDWSLDCLPQQASKLAALKIDDKSNKCFVKTTRWEVIITQLNQVTTFNIKYGITWSLLIISVSTFNTAPMCIWGGVHGRNMGNIVILIVKCIRTAACIKQSILRSQNT